MTIEPCQWCGATEHPQPTQCYGFANCPHCGGIHFGSFYCPYTVKEKKMEGQTMTPMPKYKCHKEVWALKIKAVSFDHDAARKENRETDGSATLTPVEEGYAPFKVDREYVRKHFVGAQRIERSGHENRRRLLRRLQRRLQILVASAGVRGRLHASLTCVGSGKRIRRGDERPSCVSSHSRERGGEMSETAGLPREAGKEAREMSAEITIQLLDTGYFRAQGNGPCEWAQWPKYRFWVKDEDFFPEASDSFRDALRKRLKELYESV